MNSAAIALDAVFIANRGDAALRVIRTAKRLGLVTAVACTRAELVRPTAAVDAADYAVELDGALPAAGPATAPYVDVERVVLAAERFRERLLERKPDARKSVSALQVAVHPGWGFLSERSDFANAVLERGFRWCGPSAHAMQAMGEKVSARETMSKAAVPVVPGLRLAQVASQSTEVQRLGEMLVSQVGFPLILKPVYGGGGKGMRVVRHPSELPRALQAARREARIACGDDTLLAERYLESVRHIEFQIFGGYRDGAYEAVHLYERDCSVQRRHQKIVEESPAPGLPVATREKMAQCAVRAARAVAYEGAGTVEFLYDPVREDFFFMEMNTRLQVEHPVTEMIVRTRPLNVGTLQNSRRTLDGSPGDRSEAAPVDLVEWQFRVAAGEPLPVASQDALSIREPAHAMELRVYAETPDEQGNWLPQQGRLERFAIDGLDIEQHMPTDTLRVDAGIRTGDEVSIEFDPMIAKIIVCEPERPQSISALQRLLESSQIWGVSTNVPFLQALLADEEFLHGVGGRGHGVPVTWLEHRLPLLLSRTVSAGAVRSETAPPGTRSVLETSSTLQGASLETYASARETQKRPDEQGCPLDLESRGDGSDVARLASSAVPVWRALAATAWAATEPYWLLSRPFGGFRNDGRGNRFEWYLEYPVLQQMQQRAPLQRPTNESMLPSFYRALLRLGRAPATVCFFPSAADAAPRTGLENHPERDDLLDWVVEIQQVWPAASESAVVPLTLYPDERLAIDGVVAPVDAYCVEAPLEATDHEELAPQWCFRLADGTIVRVHTPLSFALWRLGRRELTSTSTSTSASTRVAQAETGLHRRPAGKAAVESLPGQVLSPMPGRLLELLVQKGQMVHHGEPLAILEAMKMEHTVRAPMDGVVTRVTELPCGAYMPAGTFLCMLRDLRKEPSEQADKV
ncbi:methylcrotonoyl-Coenzyme A carboxylase 1 [Cyanidioschyzon merolae strain 10D]|uniref:Methylcrotonoyl-Coenzyme A carboxylase 1 n=1 Tax=Cyanidioschyzon merolae (strain NIES-3377 / 10D) TaxID=280699 RepID=M1VHZ3_CYAM1|nr:methylcrotonoyl-Coenzyme A carboxylase 1 [Cyanidioschyzon merolae strain 10D]BAM83092.1 methylcrotonoyl-Coenzyme A carboxylase 1 [Cyanidioschyzon merolae strain 10D]|eukprot:XP_005539128.1 methylcrotonoyl-Coenzyme A carboxylase 1 [Cyanidioschyzon merolae strain 10D]